MDVSYILDDLNSPQREAVSDESQFSLILAGAGSGKTRVITHKVAWLCKVHNLNPMSLLTVTFTNKAAKEKAENEAKNTAIAKFKANIEARFYTALAKQITDNVFGTDGLQQDSGTFTSPIGNEVVTWTTPSGTGNVVVTVTESDGTVTTFTMPKEDNS
mgnify:CR=1 FL=1